MSWLSKPKPSAVPAEVAEERATLQNPGLPDTDLTQIGHMLFVNCGLTWVIHGPGSFEDCFREVASSAPIFHSTQVRPNGFANLNGRSDSLWIGFEGPNGSALAYYCFPECDSGFVLDKLVLPLKELGTDWSLDMVTVNAQAPISLAERLIGARAVSPWSIAPLAHLAPKEVPAAQIPELLKSRLQDDGWEKLNDSLFRIVVAVEDDRTQILYFSVFNNDKFALLSPVGDSVNNALPALLQGREFDSFKLEMIEGTIYLADSMPSGPPSPSISEIRGRSVALAAYADRIEGDLSVEDRY